MNFRKYLVAALAGLVLISSCATEKAESERSLHERILDAYVELNYPDAEVKSSGLVMIDYVQGTGDTLDLYEAGYLEYSYQTLDGTYVETTDEQLAKELGWYSNSTHYGPGLFEIGFRTTYKGVEEALTGLRVGGKAKFILPPWLSTTYNDSWNMSTSIIYEVELKEVVRNIYTWQEDTMKAYAKNHYPGLDTLASGFYFKTLYDAGGDTLGSGSVNVYYVGRLLDGWVFDTNIADTAKKYGIYDKTKDYSPLLVSYSEDLSTMAEDNSLVQGFCKAIQNMDYGDKAFTMFNSELGYKGNGSGEIGPYQPLIFWMHIEEDKE